MPGGAVLLGLGSGCVFPGILGRLVGLEPMRAPSVTGTALATFVTPLVGWRASGDEAAWTRV